MIWKIFLRLLFSLKPVEFISQTGNVYSRDSRHTCANPGQNWPVWGLLGRRERGDILHLYEVADLATPDSVSRLELYAESFLGRDARNGSGLKSKN